MPRKHHSSEKIAVVWGNWGPYHYARFRALHDHAAACGWEAVGLELFPASGYYSWKASSTHPAVRHLNLGKVETEFNLRLLVSQLLPLLYKLKPTVILVPSYWHWSLFINYTCRFTGTRIVMMNESHAGTERARGLKRVIKKIIVRHFHAALVGGSPHRRHFAALGLAPSLIHLGYDTIDHDFFRERAAAIRQNAAHFRERYRLPEKYFLNLGRMVSKKNLRSLIKAFALWYDQDPTAAHDLVLVGSGEEESELRALCRRLSLQVVDRTPGKGGSSPPSPGSTGNRPAVHFYGFRQIDENPVFYALATAFVLPSAQEEWGLVVNEAMASALPVLVSERSGCAEDLVKSGRNGFAFDPDSVEELAALFPKVSTPSVAESMGAHSQEISSQWGCERFASGAMAAAMTALGKTSLPESEISPNHATTLRT